MSCTGLYAITQKREILASKIGNKWRFDLDEIDEWMKQQRNIDSNPKGGYRYYVPIRS